MLVKRNLKSLFCYFLSFGFAVLFVLSFITLLRFWSLFEKMKSEETSTPYSYFFSSNHDSLNRKEEDVKYILTVLQEDLCHILHSLYDTVKKGLASIYVYCTCLFTIVLCTIILSCMKIKSRNEDNGKKKKNVQTDSEENNISSISSVLHGIFSSLSFFYVVCFIFFVSFTVSLPWEYMRLYQEEIAERAAIVQDGTPPECVPSQMGILQSIKYLLKRQLSWELDPCENYYKALLVDPIWEVPPLLVIFSALSRCLLEPLKLFCSGVGKCVKLFFSEIPLPWQPVFIVSIFLNLVLLLVMSFGYRISFPFLFKIEPKTPVFVRSDGKRYQTRSVENGYKTPKDILCTSPQVYKLKN